MLSKVVSGIRQVTAKFRQEPPICGVPRRDASCLSHWTRPTPAERHQLRDWPTVDGHRDPLAALDSS